LYGFLLKDIIYSFFVVSILQEDLVLVFIFRKTNTISFSFSYENITGLNVPVQ